MDLLATIQAYKPETIYGILGVGAVGSIIGSVILYCLKKIANIIISQKDVMLRRILWRFGNTILLYDKIRVEMNPSLNVKYLGHVVHEACHFILIGISLLLVFILGIIVVMLNGFELPYTLSSIFSLLIILSYNFLKSSLVVNCLIGDELEISLNSIKENHPKNYTEWMKEYNNRI